MVFGNPLAADLLDFRPFGFGNLKREGDDDFKTFASTTIHAGRRELAAIGDLLRGATLPDAALAFRFATLLLAVLVMLVGAAVWPEQKKRGLVQTSADSWPLRGVAADRKRVPP